MVTKDRWQSYIAERLVSCQQRKHHRQNCEQPAIHGRSHSEGIKLKEHPQLCGKNAVPLNRFDLHQTTDETITA
jgi:hypothetical protein